jgi:hypothetical protein
MSAATAASVGWAKARSSRAVPTRSAQRGRPALFPVCTDGRVSRVAAPINREVAACNILFETAMRPIADAADESMFYGIEVNVIDMPLKVGVVPDRVLPIPPLPQSSLALRDLARCAREIDGQSARKAALDQARTQRKIGVIWRKPPDGVNMIRQDANRYGFERSASLHVSVDAPQSVDVPNQQVTRPIGERDGEEECAAFKEGTSVTRQRYADQHAWARRAKSAPLPTLHQP